MLKPWEVIAELESDNSRLVKEAVIARESAAGNDEFFRGARAALDSMITFGIKQVPEKTGDGKGLKADKFWKVAQELAERRLTGNSATATVLLMRQDAKEAEWNQWCIGENNQCQS
jgi:DNA ligase-1